MTGKTFMEVFAAEDREAERVRRNRFPPLKRGPDGKYLCRGCRGSVPKGRRTWCSDACKKRHDPYWVKIEVQKRARCLCEMCAHPVRCHWYAYRDTYGVSYRDFIDTRSRLPAGEVHHIVPHSEGGAGTADNMQLLCHDCHVRVTTEWRKRKAKEQVCTQDRQEVEPR